MRYFIIIFLSSICLIAGCQEPEKKQDNKNFSNSRGLKRYINQEPSVKSIEKWNSEYGDGLIIETSHYRIFTTLKDPLMLRQVPGFLESAYKGYQSQVPDDIPDGTLFNVYLFADRSQWEGFTRDFAKPNQDVYLKIQRGAYYLNGACVAYNIGRKNTFGVLGHEGWHQFSSRHFKYRLPSWLDEGIAMQFEVSEYKDGFFKFKPRENLNRLGILKLALAKGRIMSIKQIISMNPGLVLIHGDGQDSAYYYAQMYSLVRFLREAGYSRRLIPYNNMLRGGLEGKWPLSPKAANIAEDRNIAMTSGYNAAIARKIFESYFGDNYERMQNEYLYFCRRLTDRLIIR